MHAELPFVHFSELAEAHERGPAAAVEVQWRLMQEEAERAPEFPEFGQLVAAARAALKLRQLFPVSSHWTLCFNPSTGIPSRPEVAIAPARNGRPFRVQRFPHGGFLGEAATATEAVALAVAHLRPGVGPAVAGTVASDE
ncbi:DUF6193 family natural product biosynthesis protein [Streptomyces sp. NPDC088816]|uniref:DUF6193 family natural product biosynthesis protein n=1 Tax=unclassified Streptomyces TaxID=2593676 RepID=UPI00380C69E0